MRREPRWNMPAVQVFVVTAAVVLVAYAGLSMEEASPAQQVPLPFDPLGPDEQAAAVDAALADPAVQALLDRYETIGAALNTDKQRLRAQPESRMADVWFYDYTTDTAVWTLVDLHRAGVVDHSVQDHQPPLTAREIVHAGTLALEDPAAAQAVADLQPLDEPGTTARLWTGTGPHSCPVHRCALVAFFADGAFVTDRFVLVNLSLDRVETVILSELNNQGAHP